MTLRLYPSKYYRADTLAERPTYGFEPGDRCYVVATGISYIATSTSTWAATSSGGPMAHAATHGAAGSDPVSVTALAGFPGGTANFLRADGTFAAPSGGPGGVTLTEVEVDVGYPPQGTKTFTISNANVSTSSKIGVYQSGNAPTGKNADDNEMDPLVLSAIPGNGQFTLIVSGVEGKVGGAFKVLYLVA